MSTPVWNAPSPLNGSVRSPNDPVICPSTGQRFGAEFARNQSAVVTLRVMPSEMPVLVAPLKAEVLSAYSWSSEELTSEAAGCSWLAVTSDGSDFNPYKDETSLASDPSDATCTSRSLATCSRRE